MNTLTKLIKSRTILTLAFLIIYNVVMAYVPMLPTNVSALVTVLLAALAGYFRINTNINFDA